MLLSRPISWLPWWLCENSVARRFLFRSCFGLVSVLHVLLKSSLCVGVVGLCCGSEVDFDHLDVFGVEDVSDVGGGETGPRFVADEKRGSTRSI